MSGTAEAKHTPGPWFGDGEPVAYCNDAMILIYREDGTEIGFAHRREDASLFGAAPDLLAALKVARGFMPLSFAATGRPGGADERNAALTDAKAKIDAALARAEGRQP